MKKIMVATDFSERSDRALRRATLLARQFDAAILLVHVVDDDQPRRIVDAEGDEASTLLRQMAATLRDVDGREPCESPRRPILCPVVPAQLRAVRVAGRPTFSLLSGRQTARCSGTCFVGTNGRAGRSVRWIASVLMVERHAAPGPIGMCLQTTVFPAARATGH